MKTMNVVGIDLGSHSIKVVHLENSDVGSKLIGHSTQEIFKGREFNPDGPTSDQVLETLKNALAEAKINPKRTKRLVSSVGGASTHVKQIKSIPLSPEELNSSLIFEARKHLPLDDEQPILDFQILKGDVGSAEMEVMLVATSRKTFDKHREILQLAGFPVDEATIDIDVLALANSFLLGQKSKVDGLTIMLDLGARTTNIIVLGEESPFFNRTVNVGGLNFTNDVIEKEKVSYVEAEKYKMSHNVFIEDEGQSGMSLTMVKKGCQEQLLEEIKRSLRYYAKENNNSSFKQILVSGGSAKLQGLIDYLNKELNLPTSLFNPMNGIMGGVNDPQLTQAVGLALRRE